MMRTAEEIIEISMLLCNGHEMSLVQPHHPLWSWIAGARMTMKDLADEKNNLINDNNVLKDTLNKRLNNSDERGWIKTISTQGNTQIVVLPGTPVHSRQCIQFYNGNALMYGTFSIDGKFYSNNTPFEYQHVDRWRICPSVSDQIDELQTLSDSEINSLAHIWVFQKPDSAVNLLSSSREFIIKYLREYGFLEGVIDVLTNGLSSVDCYESCLIADNRDLWVAAIEVAMERNGVR